MRFHYTIYTPSTGKTQRGTLEAPSEAEAEQTLWQQDCVIVSLTPAKESAWRRSDLRRTTLARLFPGIFGTRPAQVMAFTRHLAVMMGAGVGILPALRSLREQSGTFGSVIEGMLRELQGGVPLSEAIARRGRAFPPFYEPMVRVGEKLGNLGAVWQHLALVMEKEQAFNSRLRRLLVYVIGTFVGIVAVLVAMTMTVSGLIGANSEMQSELTTTTRIILTVAFFIGRYGIVVLLVLFLTMLLLPLLAQNRDGRLMLDRVALSLPFIGSINRTWLIACYTGSLSWMLQAGLSLLEAMAHAEAVITNRAAQHALAGIRRDVIHGVSFSEAMARRSLFSPALSEIVRVGEQTGNLPASMAAIADLYEDETNRTIEDMTAILVPIAIIAGGLTAVLVLLTITLPLYDILRLTK